MIDLILTQTLNGLASASSLFLVASGLSIIFGVTRIVNFAHGSLYMLGAYLAWTLVGRFGPAEALGFWGGVLAAAAKAPAYAERFKGIDLTSITSRDALAKLEEALTVSGQRQIVDQPIVMADDKTTNGQYLRCKTQGAAQ